MEERCYVCGGGPHADTTAKGGHKYWAESAARAEFAAEGARLSRPGYTEARYVATYRPY